MDVGKVVNDSNDMLEQRDARYPWSRALNLMVGIQPKKLCWSRNVVTVSKNDDMNPSILI